MGLSNNKKLLLLKALKNNGRLQVEMAEQLYSGRNAAKQALSSLEFEGFIRKDESVPAGVFRIEKCPDEVVEKYKAQQKEE